ncbi:MAG: Uma2 family endonuclease [Planctomycetales bacterium]
MSTILDPTIAEPHVRRFTRDEYYRMGELGWFEGQRVQLLDGEIVVMSPQKWRHASTIDRIAELLRSRLGDRFWVRMQLPLNLDDLSEPEPDVSVLPGKREDFHDHPTTALLVVEVADSSLAIDRNRKTKLYAAAGIPEYWIIDLVHDALEVFRKPQEDPSRPGKFLYAERSVLRPGEMISPLLEPAATIAVAEILA